ncbi:MAG TPA: hypothetical protein VMY05_06270 [Acidobacteriota bacterium]|nr:hypothetical protein [Acidobacteriota bacterium]
MPPTSRDRSAAVLLSRQALRPTGRSQWVCRVAEAVRYVKEKGCLLHTSVGMQTWDLLTALASMEHIPVRIFVTSSEPNRFVHRRQRILYDFDLSPQATDFVPVEPVAGCATKEAVLRIRDEAVIEGADLLVPVSVRHGGHMYTFIAASGKPVVSDFQVPYQPRGSALAYRLPPDCTWSGAIRSEGQYLYHWTRGVSHAWPDERQIEFYRDVITSDEWPRGALATLRRILRTKRIIASGRHMPGGEPTVSFSALSPDETVPLMRWRSRYAEMSFEPYGLGIDCAWAERRGARPVRYCSKQSEAESSESPLWLQQSVGRVTDWRSEKEFRHRGDFSLEGIPADRMVLLCLHRDEAAMLEREFGISSIYVR